MYSKDINASHVWKVTRAFSATSAEWNTVGPSEAIADTLSPEHLVLISRPYTNTYISTHTKGQTHTGKHFCRDPPKKIPLNSWTSDMTGVKALALSLWIHTPQPCNKSWWVIIVQRVHTCARAHTHSHTRTLMHTHSTFETLPRSMKSAWIQMSKLKMEHLDKRKCGFWWFKQISPHHSLVHNHFDLP